MDYLPVFLDLRAKLVLLVGGGPVAARKVALLQAAGARLRIVAPERCAELETLCANPGTEYLRERFAPDHMRNCVLAIAATDSADTNREVAAAAQAERIWVNVVDDAASGNCLMPSIIDRSPVIIAIGTGGATPTLARRLRARIEALLPERLGLLARAAGERRELVRAALPAMLARQHFWDDFFDSALAQQILAAPLDAAAIDAGFDAQIDAARLTALDGNAQSSMGIVWLIGAGPGDPDLLTLRAQQLLQQCDVLLYDRLVPEAVLARVRRDAERIFVGKQPGSHRTTQLRIHQLMIEHARRGRRVARLKGGDPMVFARGGEELAALAQAGVPVIVVPGVTAALGAASSARIPLTHRGASQSVCFVTAMGEAAAALDWRALAAPLQTVVFYMGASQLPQIVARLIEQGAPPARPAAIVEHATLPGQRVIAGKLCDIAAKAATATVRAPALLVVGEVAQFAAAEVNAGASSKS